MKKITILLLLILGFYIAEAYAQETDQTLLPDEQDEEYVQPEHYMFPDIKPEISLTGGYRYVHTNGSSMAEEFEYLHNSLVVGGDLRTVTQDHRLHLDFEVRNEKDYYGDMSYAYRDLVLFRGVNSTLFHNLDNIELKPFGTNLVINNDPDGKYGIKVDITNLFLRFKTPDFPAHLYFEGNFVGQEGTVQQMFFNNTQRTSDKRDIDLRTSIYTFGADSHLGPVEVDLSHSEKRLDVDSDKFLVFSNTDFFPPPGDYAHNLIPELKSSTNTLKLHTSSTGSLVASATLSKTDKENKDSGTTADYLFAAGEVTWMPLTELTFFLKYRHQERDVDNPDTVTVRNLSDGSIFGTFPVRNSISSVSDSVSGIVRYRLVKGVVLKADYTYEDIRRNDVEEWHVIPDSTQRQKFSLSGDVRIMAGLKLKAKYTHKDINNPSTNTEPNTSDEGLLSLSWMPVTGLNTFINYGIKKERRDSVLFLADTTSPTSPDVINGGKRDVHNDRLIGTISYALLRNLSLSASYAYMHDKVQQGVLFYTDGGFPAAGFASDPFIPYKTTSRNYSFDLNFSPNKFITVNGGISHTVSQGTFYTSVPALDTVASYSELKIRETRYNASGEYQFKGGVSAGIQYRYSTLKDVLNNIYDDVNDGRVSIILLTLSKKW